jgi:endonuclease YncB( thermonuclease family)
MEPKVFDRMSSRSVAKTSWLTVALVGVAVVIWLLDLKRGIPNPTPSVPGGVERSPSKKPAGNRESAGNYEVYRNCRLAEARNNDGDSFMIRLPDGKQAEFRLYFVDTPESAFKNYSNGETNHERIRQQAAEMGGITPEQAVEIGRKGKTFTLGLLGSRPFTIFTCWDSPYHDERYHAFVQVTENGKSKWLEELLVERGLVRIKTKPADLPDGTPASRHLDHLRDLERQAKRNHTGVWGL